MQVATPETPFWNPYVAGFALGLVLLSTFLIMGNGLGASGAVHRIGVTGVAAVAPEVAASVPMMAELMDKGANPLDDWLVFEVLGALLGGLVASYSAGRLKLGVIRGPRISIASRLLLAVAGGVLMGVAARFARGCTSGQALSGGSLLSAGSWIFMMAVFGGGYAVAWFVRRQWR